MVGGRRESMATSQVVIIGPSEAIQALEGRTGVAGSTLTFHEGQALEALDAIADHRPPLVVLESAFAATPRGVALVNRIKADSSLDGVEIRILGTTAAIEDAMEPSALAPSQAVALPERTAPPQLDHRGTRRAPRFTMAPDVHATIDNKAVMLLDLSTLGIQLCSTRTLRPNQRTRPAIGVGVEVHRMVGRVAWAQFEAPGGQPHYRAGIEFVGSDVKALDELCQRFQTAIV